MNLKPLEVAKLLNVTVKTLQNWDYSGKLKAFRSVSGRRFYTQEQVNKLLNIEETNKNNLNIIYARVSGNNQKEDLENQIQYLKSYCSSNSIIIDDCLFDIGSGLNYNRKNWNKLLGLVSNSLVKCIFITNKDRFIRFGYEWFKLFCKKHNCEIIEIDHSDKSKEEELVEDLLNIVHVFSSRHYGIRKYKKSIEVLQDGNKIEPRPEEVSC